MKILVPLGTRPEIIKLAPVVSALAERGVGVRTVATGQHHDPELTDAFFDGLGLRPDIRWDLPVADADRLGSILTRAVDEISSSRPDLVLVLGDTNTVPLFCLAARRATVPIAHLEAGMRSLNETSIEEVNRKVAAACCSLHFAPTDVAAGFLRAEGVAEERIRVVGNPVLDVLAGMGAERRPVAERRGMVVTAHRATNVDDPVRLRSLVDLVTGLAALAAPVVFPVHPRTRARLEAAGWFEELAAAPGVEVRPPIPYAEMVEAMSRSLVVVTDSGGLQEEASWLGLPAVVLRRSTPRWEGVRDGASVLVGMDVHAALDAAARFLDPAEQERVAAIACPYGDGHTARRVADILTDPATQELLVLAEPDFTGGRLPGGV